MENDRTLVHVTRIPIRWGDMDAMGHVNNTAYFRYMEQARVEWFEALGYFVRPAQQSIVIANASCTFRIPLSYPGIVEVRMYALAPGRSSVTSHYELRREGEPGLIAEGAARIVWIDGASGRPIPMPGKVRALIAVREGRS
ncbi:MAG TPA: thioesterase [Rhodocyclaceae bacterium]|nr:MAG: thioesterase [Betaproteobacteria bacterium CG2_30_68_42]PIV72250.1 MAG: thioesterase [Rhodocyclales bacterium CG17_big_fil_post_rev_8_21_14_2_50_68_7]HCX32862.1 thioesterase [Rhodocyclaceae bacterium]